MIHLIFFLVIILALPIFNKYYPFYIFSFLSLVLVLSLRFEYGNDYSGYLLIHNMINNGQFAWGSTDILFKWVNQIVPNFELFIFMWSVFYIFTIYLLFKKALKVKEYWLGLSVLLINPYLLLIHLSSIRQTLALCCFVIAILFAKKRQFGGYCVAILVAAGFHSTAILLFPIYFILNDRPIGKRFLSIGLGVLSILLTTPIFDYVISKVIVYYPFYKHYYLDGLVSSMRTTIISAGLFLIILLNLKKAKQEDVIFWKLAIVFNVITLLALKLAMLSRFAMYFEIFMVVVISKLISGIEVKWKRYLVFVFIFGVYLMRYLSFFMNPTWAEFYGIYKVILFK